MTNLSPDLPSWKRKITRERLLLGLPILVGGIVAAGFAVVVVMPAQERIAEQQQRIETLREQQLGLPGLMKQTSQADAEALKEKQQQDLLVDLMAGKDKIQTFLAQLSREAKGTGVWLELYEPVDAPSTSSVQKSSSRELDEESSISQDPMAVRGYEKTAVLLQARASFVSLQAFLRRMETLNFLVEQSDLQLMAIASVQMEDEPPAPALTQLNLRLSFYDKSSPSSQQSSQAELDSY